jgi:hypothetical protein
MLVKNLFSIEPSYSDDVFIVRILVNVMIFCKYFGYYYYYYYYYFWHVRTRREKKIRISDIHFIGHGPSWSSCLLKTNLVVIIRVYLVRGIHPWNEMAIPMKWLFFYLVKVYS